MEKSLMRDVHDLKGSNIQPKPAQKPCPIWIAVTPKREHRRLGLRPRHASRCGLRRMGHM